MKNNLLIILISIYFLILLSGCNEIIKDNNHENEKLKPEIIDVRLIQYEKEGYHPQLHAVGLVKNMAKININSVSIILKLINQSSNIIYSEIINIKPEIIKPNDYGVFIFRKSVDIHDSAVVEINSYSYTNETYYDNFKLQNIKINENNDNYFSIDGLIKNNGNKNVHNITILVLAFDNETKILDIGGSEIIDTLDSGQLKYFKASISIFDKSYNVNEIKSTDVKITYDTLI